VLACQLSNIALANTARNSLQDHLPLVNLGMDSLSAVELANWSSEHFGLPPPATGASRLLLLGLTQDGLLLAQRCTAHGACLSVRSAHLLHTPCRRSSWWQRCSTPGDAHHNDAGKAGSSAGKLPRVGRCVTVAAAPDAAGVLDLMAATSTQQAHLAHPC